MGVQPCFFYLLRYGFVVLGRGLPEVIHLQEQGTAPAPSPPHVPMPIALVGRAPPSSLRLVAVGRESELSLHWRQAEGQAAGEWPRSAKICQDCPELPRVAQSFPELPRVAERGSLAFLVKAPELRQDFDAGVRALRG